MKLKRILYVVPLYCILSLFACTQPPSGTDEKSTEYLRDAGTTDIQPDGTTDSKPDTAPVRSKVTIMSFNIRYGSANDGENVWGKRKSIVFDVIRKQGGDFVGLQEALLFQIEEIHTVLPQYRCFGRGRDGSPSANPDYNEWNPICYLTSRWTRVQKDSGTFWLSKEPDKPSSKSWNSSLPRICTWARFIEKSTGKSIYILNTHYDHKSALARSNSSKVIAQHIFQRSQQKAPVFLLGDFNEGESGDAIRYLRGESVDFEDGGKQRSPVPLVDTFRVLHPNAGKTGTYNYWFGFKLGPKIDSIFSLPLTSGTEIVSAKIIHDHVNGRFPSDHFPVTTTIQF